MLEVREEKELWKMPRFLAWQGVDEGGIWGLVGKCWGRGRHVECGEPTGRLLGAVDVGHESVVKDGWPV